MISHEIIGDDMQAVVITMGASCGRTKAREEVKRGVGGTLGAIGDLIDGDR